MVVGAVESEVAQRCGLGLDAVEPGALKASSMLLAAANSPTRVSFLVLRCGAKLSSTTAILTSGG